MADSVSRNILEQLVAAGALPIEQATALMGGEDLPPTKLRAALVDKKLVDEEAFTQAWAKAIGLLYISLPDINIPKAVLAIIPESTARGHMIVAYESTREVLRVAMADPYDRQIIEFIHKKVNVPVEVALASESGIREALAQYQESLESELTTLAKQMPETAAAGDLAQAAEDVPTVKTVDMVLKHAITQGASDIHIEPTETQVVVRYRVDGILQDVLTLDKRAMAGLVARIKILSNLKIDEHRLPQDGRFKIESADYKVAFRVSILPVFDGEKVVMRLLDESGHGLGLDEIGMSEGLLAMFRRNIRKANGMVLVTGPTGSGKTTTLYAAMRELNTPDVNISTVEDPIEYRMPRINQTQVHPVIGLTFASGLRSLVRQDPDILMVGEIRDEETASLAVNAALTGHLVLSTLHTNSAAGALPRLLDMGVEAFLVSSTTNLLVAQRLVRKLCDKCRRQMKLNKTMLDSLTAALDTERLLAVLKREKAVPEGADWKTIEVYEPQGCRLCNEGYKGRIGIYEGLEVTPEIQKTLTATTTSQELEDVARKQQGMVSMLEDGVMKVVLGITSLAEVLRVAQE